MTSAARSRTTAPTCSRSSGSSPPSCCGGEGPCATRPTPATWTAATTRIRRWSISAAGRRSSRRRPSRPGQHRRRRSTTTSTTSTMTSTTRSRPTRGRGGGACRRAGGRRRLGWAADPADDRHVDDQGRSGIGRSGLVRPLHHRRGPVARGPAAGADPSESDDDGRPDGNARVASGGHARLHRQGVRHPGHRPRPARRGRRPRAGRRFRQFTRAPVVIVGHDMRPSGVELVEEFARGRHGAGGRRDRPRARLHRPDLLRRRPSRRARGDVHRLPQPGPVQRHQAVPGRRPPGRRRHRPRRDASRRRGRARRRGPGAAPRAGRLEHAQPARVVRRPRAVVHRRRLSCGRCASWPTPPTAWADWSCPAVFERLPRLELEVMYGELDGTFPNHPADPLQPANQTRPAGPGRHRRLRRRPGLRRRRRPGLRRRRGRPRLQRLHDHGDARRQRPAPPPRGDDPAQPDLLARPCPR